MIFHWFAAHLDTLVKVMGVLVGATAIGASIYVAWLTHKRAIMPVLVFLFGDGVWTLKNVGVGPALNVLVARRVRDPNEDESEPDREVKDRAGETWIDLIQCYPLAPKDSLILKNYDRAFALGATYTDAYGTNEYSSFCRDYWTEFHRGNRYYWDRSKSTFEADVPALKGARSTGD